MGYTLVEKILMKNAGVDHVSVGDIVITKPDMFMIHDIYTCYLVDALKNMETEVLDDPSKVTIIFDHCMPTAVAKNDSAHYDAGIYLTENMGWTGAKSTSERESATPSCTRNATPSPVRLQRPPTATPPPTAAPDVSVPESAPRRWRRP